MTALTNTLLCLGLIVILDLLYMTAAETVPQEDEAGPGGSTGNFSCYHCNSYFSPTCADHFNNRTWELSPCKPDERMCRKVVQEAWYDASWNIRYIRHCARLGTVGYDEGRRCVDRIGTYRIKMRYCHCDNKDGCNAAGTLRGRFLSVMMVPLLTLVLRWLTD